VFNFTFSFAAALWALPLAGVPILLHLLFKQKSPVVQFSTLRFIKLSIQRTAARKRVQKWLLLACRALLVALLIWAIAQPVHQLTSSWLGGSGGGGRSTVAAVVMDTSYSMLAQEGQVTLLSREDGMVQDLLRNQLSGAKVALFRSQPGDSDHPERAEDAAGIVAGWTPLKPQASPKPLVDRVTAAVNFLQRNAADQKWLVVLTDFQSREFPHGMPELKDGRTVLLDLHPNDPRSAGITKISLNPAQPIPGIPLQANIEVTGQPGSARALKLRITTADGNPVSESPTDMVTLDSSGQAHKQLPIRLPAERWLLLTAMLTDDDAMQWDNTRTQLVEVPPKQNVSVLNQSGSSGERILRLALDPSEGKLTEWPLAVMPAGKATGNTDVIVADFAHWPTPQQAAALHSFANAGHTVILFLNPGLERSWPGLQKIEQDDLAELLPSPPLQRPGNMLCRAAVGDARDPLLEGLIDEKYQLNAIVVRQLVPLAASGFSSTVLNAVPVDPTPGSRTQGLLFRKAVGRGVCFTFSTAPDPAYTNLATHPTFLPLLVRMALKTPEQSAGQNVELGQPVVLDGSEYPHDVALQIDSPAHEQYRVPAIESNGSREFVFSHASDPGLYTWRTINNPTAIAMTNVQLPAGESDLTYRPAASVAPPGPDTLIASSMDDLNSKVASLTAPRPQWSGPLAIVMFLLCLEALMGSWSKAWNPSGLRAFMPGMKSEPAMAGSPPN
jgi:hypothetical protein